MFNERLNQNQPERLSRQETQKRKLEGFYASGGNDEYIFNPQYTPQRSDHEKTLEMMQKGQVSKNMERNLLMTIAGPTEVGGGSSDNVFEGMSRDKHMRRILGYMTNGTKGFNEYTQTNPSTVEDFLDRYKTPMDFESDAGDFLTMIERLNGEEKRKQYEGSMADFKRRIYGKKLEYYEAMKSLHKEAESATNDDITIYTMRRSQNQEEPRITPQKEQIKEEFERPRDEKRLIGRKILELFKKKKDPEQNQPRQEKQGKHERRENQKQDGELFEINSRRSLEILRHSNVEGDPVGFFGRPEKRITPRELERAGLTPRFETSLEGVKFGISEAFKIGGGRDAVISYVTTETGETFARGYYRSNSAGVWRYLPDYTKKEGRPSWYGKGANEQQLTLPSELQGALNEVAEKSYSGKSPEEPAISKEKYDCFFGTAKKIPYGDNYHEKRYKNQYTDALDNEVEGRPTAELTTSLESVGPERMVVPKPLSPNFQAKAGAYNLLSRYYDDATAEVFYSNDRNIKWTFIRDKYGRASIGGAELTTAKITSTGLRSEWVDLGDYAMPLYEYPSQTLGLGDQNDTRGGYECMWNNCLRKMPLIREYCTHNQHR